MRADQTSRQRSQVAAWHSAATIGGFHWCVDLDWLAHSQPPPPIEPYLPRPTEKKHVSCIVAVSPFVDDAPEWLGQELSWHEERVEGGGGRYVVHYRDGMFLAPCDTKTPRCLLRKPERILTLRGAFGAAALWALAEKGCLLVHAAALALNGHAVLILGRSGAGKSTLSIAWILSHGKIISDDAVLVAHCNGALFAESWRKDVALRPGSFSVLPDALAERLRSGSRQRRWLVRDEHPDAFCDDLPLGALVLLSTDEARPRRSRVERTHGADALAALYAANSHLAGQVLPDARLANQTAEHIAASLPVLRLVAGSDLLSQGSAEARRIRDLIAQHIDW